MTEPVACDRRLCCTFWLGAYRFGIDAVAIREIRAHTACTPIPLAPPAVRGYVNLRGHLYLALDLRSLIDMPASAARAEGYLIVFQAAVGASLAVCVDRIGGTVEIRQEEIDRPRDGGGDTGAASWSAASVQDLLEGVARLDDGLLTILEPRRLLPALARGSDGGMVPRS